MSEDKRDMGNLVESALNLSALKGFTAEKKFGRPGRTIVMMGQRKAVEASDTDTEVFTFGATGCNVVAIEGVRKGRRFGVITHYDPLSISNNDRQIEQLGGRIGKAGRGEKTNAEIFVRGDWEKVGDKWEMKPKDASETDRLVQIVKRGFGDNTTITVTPYSETRKAGNENQGQVSIDISPKSQRKKRILGIF